MAGPRAFDDARWPDAEGFADCFICGHPVDPASKKRVEVAVTPLGSPRGLDLDVRLPAHEQCAKDTPRQRRAVLHQQALDRMARSMRSRVA